MGDIDGRVAIDHTDTIPHDADAADLACRYRGGNSGVVRGLPDLQGAGASRDERRHKKTGGDDPVNDRSPFRWAFSPPRSD